MVQPLLQKAYGMPADVYTWDNWQRNGRIKNRCVFTRTTASEHIVDLGAGLGIDCPPSPRECTLRENRRPLREPNTKGPTDKLKLDQATQHLVQLRFRLFCASNLELLLGNVTPSRSPRQGLASCY